VVVHTDHATFKHLFSKKDAKLRLFRWILLLSEFDCEIHNRKGSENMVAKHLSQIIVEKQSESPFLRASLISSYLWFNLNHGMLVSSTT